jgi:branched-chain amino acid transport system substrate-binding protein
MPRIQSLARRQVSGGLAALLVFATACGIVPAASTGPTPIKVGVLVELTGPGSFYGTSEKEMIEMALAKVNNKAGGRPVQVIYEDDATDPATAVTKARSLIEQQNVDVLFGPTFSDSQEAMAPYLATKKIMDIAPYGAPFDLAQYNNWIVYPGTTATNCAGLGGWLYDQGYRTLTSLGADYVAGRDIINFINTEFKAKGGQVVQEQWAPLGTSDFAPYMSQMAKADAFVEWTIMPDQLALMQAHTTLGVTTPLIECGSEAVTPENLAQLGPKIVGLKGMMNAYYPQLENSENSAFVAAVKQKYNRVPTNGDGIAYISFNTLLAGLEKTSGNPALSALRPAIIGLSQDTPMGTVTFTKNGYAVTNKYIVDVTNTGGQLQWSSKPLQTITGVVDPQDK